MKHSAWLISKLHPKTSACPECTVSLSWPGVSWGHHVHCSPATSSYPQEPADTFETVHIFPAELQGQAWYHSLISRETAETRLKSVPYHCFLIRETDRRGHTLSLSVKHQGGISHFKIERYHNEYEIPGTHKRFMTLLQLVDFYMTNSVSGGLHHRLSSPCPRPSPDGECNGDHDVWQVSGDSVPSFRGLPFSLCWQWYKMGSQGRHH